jgi:uracil-DNA glycosylase
MSNDKSLSYLYEEIHQCHICPNMDQKKDLRKLEAVDLEADVFIVSQSLAENQLRKTGVNFFANDGKLGSTGRNLENFLNLVERTVYPPIDVRLERGKRVKRREEKYVSVYNSEITQCFTGKRKDGKGDRNPSAEEIRNCLGKGYLAREIEILKPKIVMLMGRISRNIFFHSALLNTVFPESLTEHIAQVVDQGEMPKFSLGDHKFGVLPIQHASGANPHFQRMLLDQKLQNMIIKELR